MALEAFETNSLDMAAQFMDAISDILYDLLPNEVLQMLSEIGSGDVIKELTDELEIMFAQGIDEGTGNDMTQYFYYGQGNIPPGSIGLLKYRTMLTDNSSLPELREFMNGRLNSMTVAEKQRKEAAAHQNHQMYVGDQQAVPLGSPGRGVSAPAIAAPMDMGDVQSVRLF